MKQRVLMIIFLAITLLFWGCVEKAYTIPVIVNVDEAIAKQLLMDNGVIPSTFYEYSDYYTQGCVIRTNPPNGAQVTPNSVVELYISKGPQLCVPDVKGLDEESARALLVSNSLIPQVEYQYYDYDEYPKGTVMHTSPDINAKVEPNQLIMVYVSKGPSYIESTDSRISWTYVADGEDKWQFYSPYIEHDILYIHCCDVVLFADIEWQDDYNNGF